MNAFILCIVGEWKCMEDGKWVLKIKNDQVARTVLLDGISTYQQMVDKIADVFHVEAASHKFTLMYRPTHLSEVCTQTSLPPVAIETDDDMLLFSRISASHDGMNMVVSWESFRSGVGNANTEEMGQYSDRVCSPEEDDVDDDSLLAYIEEVENEYKKNHCNIATEQKRAGKRVIIDNDDDNHCDNVVGKRLFKRQARRLETVYESNDILSAQSSSNETVPNTPFEELAALTEKDTEECSSSFLRLESAPILNQENFSFSLGVEDMGNTADSPNFHGAISPSITNDEDTSEELPDDQPQMDNVYGNGGPHEQPVGRENNIEIGSIFVNKLALRKALATHAMTQTFAFKVDHSNKSRLIAKCVASGCAWRVYAIRQKGSENFEVRTMNVTHTCSVDSRSRYGEKVTAKVLAELLQPKYANGKHLIILWI